LPWSKLGSSWRPPGPSWIEAGPTPRRALPRSAGATTTVGRPRPADPFGSARPEHVARGCRHARDDSRAVHGPVRAAGGVPLAAARLAPRPCGGARADRRLRHRTRSRPGSGAADPADDPGWHRHGTGQRADARRRQGTVRRSPRIRHRRLSHSSTHSAAGATRCFSSRR